MDDTVHDEKEVFTSIFKTVPFLGWVWIIFMSIWGSTANYIVGLKEGKHKFSCIDLFLDYVVSSFAGLMVAYICVGLGVTEWYIYAASGMAGHQGARGIRAIWSVIERKAKKI